MQTVFELMIAVCSVVGLASVVRLAILFVRTRVVSVLDMTKIGTWCFAISFLTLFFVSNVSRASGFSNLFVAWFLVHIPLSCGVLSTILLAKRRDQAVVDSLDEVLSRLMMRIREGRSLNMALEVVANEIGPKLRLRWCEVSRSVSFSPQKNVKKSAEGSKEIAEIVHELRRIDHLSRSQLGEIERWRARVRAERVFRRRSVQAMAQVRAQSIVLTAIYVCIAGFSSVAFGGAATFSALKLSLPIFLLGLFVIWRSGRRVKWSV